MTDLMLEQDNVEFLAMKISTLENKIKNLEKELLVSKITNCFTEIKTLIPKSNFLEINLLLDKNHMRIDELKSCSHTYSEYEMIFKFQEEHKICKEMISKEFSDSTFFGKVANFFQI